jgi:hypothetical protein
MTNEIFKKLQTMVSTSTMMTVRQKNEIAKHLIAVEKEMEHLTLEYPEASESICNFLVCVMFETTRRERNSVLATNARKCLLLSLRPYEETHPKLVATAYNFGDVLSALGV